MPDSRVLFLEVAAFFTAIASLRPIPANCQFIDRGPNVSIEPHVTSAAAALPKSTFRMDVNMVQIPVTVTDNRDHAVMNLPQSAFRIFEDDVEQRIVNFSMWDGPVSAGVVFDTSGSMKSRIERSRAAFDCFLDTSGPGDQFFLVRFDDRAQLVTSLTPEGSEIARQLSLIQPHGWTAMIDAIRLSLEEMRHAANPRRVLLVLSDGADNNSRYTESELFAILREADVQVYAIGLFERQGYLQRLADETGGRVIWVHKMSDLPPAMEEMSRQIRNQYVLGYFPQHGAADGKYHRLRVEVQPPAGIKKVRAAWRRGYLAQ